MPTEYEARQADQVDRAHELLAHEERARRGEMLPDFAERERARLVAACRVADEAASLAFRRHAETERRRAAQMRAAAEVTVDPAQRLADVTERQQLIASDMSGADIAAQARRMLDAGQAARASFLWDVARAKGVTDFEGFGRVVGDALDQAVPGRRNARAVEDALRAAEMQFASDRAAILAASVGMAPDGSAGTGDASQRAVARVETKASEYAASVASGEPRKFAVGDGSNTPVEDADLARRGNTRLAE